MNSNTRKQPTLFPYKVYTAVPLFDFNVHNPKGIIQLTRLRVSFSHLKEHKFRHNFHDTPDSFCFWRTNAIETTEHYLLQCSNFSAQH